jgi:hypothetical protein
MKIAKHIAFYYTDTTKYRIQYLNRIINAVNSYICYTDIFIHTNSREFNESMVHTNMNGNIYVIYHDISNEHPYFLTWRPRFLIKQQMNDYDIFMYTEDDILIPNEALEYWLTYKDHVISNGYNLGFFRIEIGDDKKEYTTDNCTSPDGKLHQYLTKTVNILNRQYVMNDQNPYCGFWIYDKSEFTKFVKSKYYNMPFNNIDYVYEYGIRETSAVGLHNLTYGWYKGTIIPLVDGKLHEGSKVYHMPNNYIVQHHLPGHWRMHLFEDVVQLK